ncbi:hypothetical protein D9M72_325090 [compost metagenome]
MDRGALGVDRHGHRHVLHVELVDGFHAQVGEAQHLGAADRLGHQVGGAADGHQVGRTVLLDRLDRHRAALGLADHGDQAGLLQHHVGELVHAGGGGGAGRADHFVAHRIDRADVVDDAVGEVHGQRLALGQHVLDALVRRVAAGQHLARQQQGLARLPTGDFFLGQRVQVDLLGLVVVRRPVHFRPFGQRRRVQARGARAVQLEMRVARGGAVRDHGDGLGGRMRREGADLDVEHRGQAAQALRADAQRVDLFIQFDAQLFQLVLRAAGQQLVHIDVFHQRLLGHQHGLFGGAADADAQHPRGAPAGAHRRNGLQHPVHQRIAGVQHGELGLVFRTAALGCDLHVDLVALDKFDVQDTGRVVARVLAREQRIVQHRGAQGVVRVQVAAAHAFVTELLQGAPGVEAHAHADLQEDVDDAGVLAQRTLAFGAHARIRQDLRHRVTRGRAFLALVGARQMADVIHGVVIADELDPVGDRLDEVFFFNDDGHGN